MLRRRSKLLAWTLSVAFHIALGALLFRGDIGGVRTLPQKSETMTRDDGDESAFTFAIGRTAEGSAPTSITISAPTGRRPVEPARPQAVPPEWQNLVRELAARPAARVEVQDVSPVDFREPTEAPKAPGPMREADAKAPFGEGQPLHGPLPAGRSVVYILDRSTSMGLTRETFDAARAAALASVTALPDEALFQVIAYNGQAVRLLPGRALLAKSAAHGAALAEALRGLKPEGDSHHDRALRSALALGADTLVFVTDAGEDELAALRPILKGHAQPVAVYVSRAEAGKVSAPQVFR